MSYIKSGGGLLVPFPGLGKGHVNNGKGNTGGGQGQGGGGGGGNVIWTPALLFTGGYGGGYYNFNQATSLWADDARTVNATNGVQVKAVSDLSGNGLHLSGAVATITMSTTSGFLSSAVNFPSGAHAALSSPSSTLGSANGWTRFAVYKEPASFPNNMELIEAAPDSPGMQLSRLEIYGPDTTPYGFSFNSGNVQMATEGNTAAPGAGAYTIVIARLQPTGYKIMRQGTEFSGAWSQTLISRPGIINVGAGKVGTGASNINPFVGPMYAAGFVNKYITDAEVTKLQTWCATCAP